MSEKLRPFNKLNIQRFSGLFLGFLLIIISLSYSNAQSGNKLKTDNNAEPSEEEFSMNTSSENSNNLPIPYLLSDGGDFESNQEQWTANNLVGSPFELGNSNIAGKNGVASGSFAWVTGISETEYQNDSYAELISPSFNFTNIPESMLSFKAKYILETQWDGFIVEYSTDGGNTWIKLNNTLEASWYNDTNLSANFGDNQPFFSGDTNDSFINYATDISFLEGNASVVFKFVFRSDEIYTYAGIAIDDFMITSNARPTDITLSNNSISDDLGPGNLVGNFSTSDANSDDSHTYTFVNDAGGPDNAAFAISGSQLFTAQSYDASTQSIYNIKVSTDDGNGGVFEKEFKINIENSQLIAYYPFNGNAIDETGNGYDAVIEGPVLTTDIEGTSNNAFLFDGFDDILSLGVPITINGDLSINMWIFIDEAQRARLVWDDAIQYGDFLIDSDNTIFYNYRDGTSANSIFSNGQLKMNEWNMISLTREGATISLYINGSLDKSQVAFAPTEPSSFSSFGRGDLDVASFFKGKMDDIRIYAEAISGQEIAGLYGNAPITSSELFLTTAPTTIDAALGATLVVDVTDNSLYETNSIRLLYRGISEGSSASFIATDALNTTGTSYTSFLLGDEDPLGVEYKFTATLLSGASVQSETTYANISYSLNGLSIPSNRIGFSETDETAYRVLSIPLNLSSKNSSTAFSDLGEYGRDWRLYSFKPAGSTEGGAFQEQASSGVNLELGTGYFILSNGQNGTSIETGLGQTAVVRPNDPATIQIKKGWNLIGNPYNFTIDWTEVILANSGLANIDQLGTQLKVWLGSYNNSQNYLLNFQGGFVFSNEDMTIEIPSTKINSLTGNNARTISEVDQNSWKVHFELTGENEMLSQLTVGMHENAAISYDKYDQPALPSLKENVSMSVAHPEFFVPKFSTDFVPNTDYYEWPVAINGLRENSKMSLKWESTQTNSTEKKRILFDVNNQVKIDMSVVSNYNFTADEDHKFIMYYGKDIEINENLLPNTLSMGNIYPNPAKDLVAIPFTIPEKEVSVLVLFKVYNIQGELVAELDEEQYTAGFHELIWNTKDTNGLKLTPGMYFINMQTAQGQETKRLILH